MYATTVFLPSLSFLSDLIGRIISRVDCWAVPFLWSVFYVWVDQCAPFLTYATKKKKKKKWVTLEILIYSLSQAEDIRQKKNSDWPLLPLPPVRLLLRLVWLSHYFKSYYIKILHKAEPEESNERRIDETNHKRIDWPHYFTWPSWRSQAAAYRNLNQFVTRYNRIRSRLAQFQVTM